MNRFVRFLKNLANNPKTSAAGIAAVGSVVAAAVSEPTVLTEPATWATALTGVGLIVAADQNAN